jgi:hypothetical protein
MPEVEETSDGWGPLSVRESIGPGYRFGFPARLGRFASGWPSWAGGFPPFSFFLFCNFFLFSVFYFFHNFCKDASKPLKPLSEIF